MNTDDQPSGPARPPRPADAARPGDLGDPGLDEAMLAPDPVAQFSGWLAEAAAAGLPEPNAMVLSTMTDAGRPRARSVLLKSHGPDGFVFYTNRESRKAADIAANPRAALLFHWKSLRRQIRIEGPLGLATDAESDAYFASRHRDSQLGAWASDQSRPLDTRDVFEARFEAAQARFAGRDVPRPPHWGGYRLTPERIEFWQDRAHRLHERRLFVRDEDGGAHGWSEGLLYP